MSGSTIVYIVCRYVPRVQREGKEEGRATRGAVARHVTREVRNSKSNRETINVRRRRARSEVIYIEESITLQMAK